MRNYIVDAKALKKKMIEEDIPTILELSRKSGVSKPVISGILNYGNNVTSDTIDALSEALNLTSSEVGNIFFKKIVP